MAICKVISNFNPGWRGGELIEVSGDQLKEYVAKKYVEIVVPDEIKVERKKVKQT